MSYESRGAGAGGVSPRLVWTLGLLVTAAATAAASAEEFKPLFDGKSLAGWHGDPELWSVDSGAIVGTTDKKQIKENTFLVSDKKYGDFTLKLKFKLRNGNSGVQFRAEELPNFVVRGYQADIADNQFMGILYDEKGRGILVEVDPAKVQPHVKAGDWNEYQIKVDGPHITQELNGYETVSYEEKSPKAPTEGIIALQLHVGPNMRVEFKDIEIKEQ